MFLITTADERAWKRNEKTLFLGEWCKLFSRRHIWSEMDYEVLYYHWDDRNRLYADYIQLNKIYERFLKVLATKLNDIHSVDYSIRYWRIIIGPWLKKFVNILYDRYLSIKSANENGNITDTWLLKSHYSDWIPVNNTEFTHYYNSDEY